MLLNLGIKKNYIMTFWNKKSTIFVHPGIKKYVITCWNTKYTMLLHTEIKKALCFTPWNKKM